MWFWVCSSPLLWSQPNTYMLLTKDTSVLFCPQVLNSLLNCTSETQFKLLELPSSKSWLMAQKGERIKKGGGRGTTQLTCLGWNSYEEAVGVAHIPQHLATFRAAYSDPCWRSLKWVLGTEQWIIFIGAAGIHSKRHTDNRQHGALILSANCTINC